jgi:LAO/AO transport system kinase
VDLGDLTEGVLARDPRVLGRAISRIERGGGEELVRSLHRRTARARRIGVTGPPGAGKSTLVDALARHYRQRGESVAILAVDPSSPFTGGALLGDRVRMQSLYTDPEVFIRSMATRGALGGLAAAAHDALDVLDAAGFDTILVETVGVGQDEVEVVRAVDTTAVVVVPGMGDDVQAAKAGLLEIADVFVLNKADRDGADETARDLKTMLSVAEDAREGVEGMEEAAPTPEIVRTVASKGEGVAELAEALARHRESLGEEGLAARRRERMRLRVERLVAARALAAARGEGGALEAAVDAALADGTDPYRVADALFASIAPGSRGAAGRDTDSEEVAG